MKKPNLFIVGEPKSGTTALAYLLAQHPDIIISKVKEPQYFCKDFHKESDTFHKGKKYFPFRKKQEYLKLFSKEKKEKIIGEASTLYLYSSVSAEEICKFNPNSKIITVFREPIDFLYSLYYEYQYSMGGSLGDFKTELELENQRKKGKEIPSLIWFPSYLYYSERVKYTEHLQRFLKFFKKRQIKIIIYDDFKKDNLRVCKEIFSFLNIDNKFIPELKFLNKNKMLRFPKLKLFIESSFFTKLVSTLLSDKIYGATRKVFRKLVIKNESRPPMDAKLRKKLMKKFKPEVVRLNKLLRKEGFLNKKKNLVKLWGYDKI